MQPAPPPPAAQDNQYQPSQPNPLIMEEFNGLYTSTTRPGVDDKACWWIDGYLPFGRRSLRTLPGVGPVLWTIPGSAQIVFFNFANIGSTPISVAVLSDGSIYQINTSTGGFVQMGPAGTISNPSIQTVGITQYGSKYIIIVSVQTNGYFVWDGTTLWLPGQTGPFGTVPTAIGGSAVETYSGRVWVANGATIFFTAPGSLVDFSSGSGGGSFTSSDSFLRVGFTQLVQTNGFLYLIADSSINYISGVQTAGTPPVTTFTNQNADPEVGTPYPATVDLIGRNIVFANAWGAHVSYGAAVTKISEATDGFYSSVPNFGGLQISAAKAIIYNKRIWMILMPVVDLFTGTRRTKLVMWDSQKWFVSEQDVTLTYIQHQEINSVITAYGTDGNTIHPLFQQPSVGFTKRVMSKFWDTPIGYQEIKMVNRFWAMAQYYVLQSDTVKVYLQSENPEATGGNSNFTLTPTSANVVMNWTTLGGQPMVWTTLGGQPMVWTTVAAGINVFDPVGQIAQQGVLLGFTLETNCADMAWISAMIQPEIWSYRG
jgi:hypothetical protein